MEQRGIKLITIAEKAEIKSERFYRIISGESNMTPEEFRSICLALNVSPMLFLNMNDEVAK